MDELFRNVREACSPAVWSKGVELARGDSVTGDKDTGAEVHLRVLARAGGVSPRVILSVEDGAWECSCGGDDPCAHVAAAVIAIRRAREQGLPLPQSAAAEGRLVYRFRRDVAPGSNNLLFIRRLAAGGNEEPLPAPLAALTSGRVKGPSFAATAEDHAVDQALAGERGELLPAKVFPALLAALARVEGLTLDGAPLAVDPAPVGPIVVVRDDGPGVRVEAAPDPAIKETFGNGIALCATGLRPIARPQLTPPEQEILRAGRFFGRQELGFLVAEVLPGLETRLRVEIRTDRLPRRTAGRPRLELDLTGAGARLMVQPAIVYGDPVTARVKSGLLYTYGNTAPARDMDHERRLRDDLSRQLGLELDQKITLPAAEAIAFVERLGRFDGDVVGAGADDFRLLAPLNPQFAVAEDSFQLAFASAPGKTADPAAVVKAWRAGESLVQLLEGGFAPLPRDWLARYGDRILELLAARGEGGDAKLPKAAAPLLAELAGELGLGVPPALAALRDALAQFDQIPRYTPRNLRAELRDYQRRGVDWLAFLRAQGLGALLADDMGLGKTLQAIAVIEGRTLVVAPTSVAPNWLAELARFRPDLRVGLYHGGGRALDPAADVTITTYAILRLDLEHLAPVDWDMVVLDEAQLIKNPQSQVARAAYQLAARFRVALSGTPVENRLDDLYSQMRFLNPGLLGDLKSFQELYSRPIEQGDPAAAGRLRRRVKPFVLRRLKSEVAPELPPRTDVLLHVVLSDRERDRYEAIKAATRKEVLEKLAESGNVLAALEALLRLRQAASHPDLLPGVEGEASSKVVTFMERLAESLAGGHKALVFSQWTSFLDLLEPPLQAAGVSFLRLDGSTADRQGVVRAFQAEGGPSVLIMSLKAGGVGLNLTAADHVFIMDPWWNPAAETQAADRAHRIGQDNPVLVHRLVSLGTVEERILLLQEKKRALAEAVVGAGGAGQGLTREDLLALFD